VRDSGGVELSKRESVSGAFSFGRYRLIPTRQLLLRDGVPVPIGSRALEILTVLVQRCGELVSKHELIAAVWPDTFVDESNLKVNVCSLRRSLGDAQKQPQYIATVAGRGYRFIAPVTVVETGGVGKTTVSVAAVFVLHVADVTGEQDGLFRIEHSERLLNPA
jgi:DNA-binding winged helix-turn-helix (wHTH) protein